MRTIKTLAALLLSLTLTLEAQAAITRQTVSRAWKRVSKAANFHELPINFENDSEPNAWVMFADENNYSLHVTAGLMRLLNTEDEIAGVLGHELGHIKLGHYNNDILSDTVNILMNTNSEHGDSLAAAVSNIQLELRESNFNREQETEADEYGTKLLSQAGYDSRGLYNAMKRFVDNGLISNTNGFNSHPAGRERLKHLAELAGESSTNNRDDIDSLAETLMGKLIAN